MRDDPAGRLALAAASYERSSDPRGGCRRFRRAALAFMRWEVDRGVLNPLDGPRPGSPWWRALNDRLLLDGCEAAAWHDAAGTPSSPAVERWIAFHRRPAARTWYHAHNASIVAAYLEHADLAEAESRVERFFLNVVLARVLYAHALVAAPRLALGRMALWGPALGDPRRGGADLFLSMGRVLPDRYPAHGRIENYRRAEHRFGRVLDFAVIHPRLDRLYDWSARELGHGGLADLVVGSVPAYAWSPRDHGEWHPPALPVGARAVGRLTAAR